MTAVEPGATAPLITTKLRPPGRRRALVTRPRLDALAERSRHRALTLVSAPAGFGKTTLVAGWLGGGSAAWVSLDGRDDDPVRFWTYVLAAIDAAVPDLGSEADVLLHAPGAPLEVVVATLINDLETAGQDLVLVLDDYHLISSIEVHESVAFLLDHLPPQIRLVIATRADPPLPLSSLRAAGDLLEVRAADLRFTTDEATSYLSEAMDLPVTPADVDVLEARTEGWIAALQLAALSMQKQSDPSTFVAEFAGDDRFILDYLADEVLERQTDAVRAFLLDTSILTRLTGPLCDAVTETAGSRAVLDDLDRSNLFLVPLDDRRTWYRYHHLFGDVLRARLLDEHPERRLGLHRRASDWLAANGETHEAITHALAGEDPVRAAVLIERLAPEMQRTRQEGQLRAWLEALPPETFDDRPVLAMAFVGARMATGDATGLEPLLAIVDRWQATDEAPTFVDEIAHRRLPAMAAVHRAGLALLAGDLEGATAHAERVLALAHPDDLLQRGAAAALLGLARWADGDLVVARDRYTESIACFVAGGYLPDAMGCSIALADLQMALGRLRDAGRTFEAALAHTVDNPGLRGAADMHVGLAMLAIERDDLDEADRRLRASAELGEAMGLPQHPYRWRVAAAVLHRAQGELDEARRLMSEAAERYVTDFSPSVRPVTAMLAGLAIQRGDLDVAERWAVEVGVAVDDDLTYLREFEHLTLARLLVARGTIGGDEAALTSAIELLDRLHRHAEAGGRSGSAIEIGVVAARALLAAEATDRAMATLAEAVAAAAEEGYVRTFGDAGPEVIAGLRLLDGEAGAWAASIVAAGAAVDSDRPRIRTADPDELSDRELDVLRLLRTDLTGPEIARELHVSLNTLRTHTKHIYTKLGATNRREAITRAGERGL